jgi:hypothetical protein
MTSLKLHQYKEGDGKMDGHLKRGKPKAVENCDEANQVKGFCDI